MSGSVLLSLPRTALAILPRTCLIGLARGHCPTFPAVDVVHLIVDTINTMPPQMLEANEEVSVDDLLPMRVTSKFGISAIGSAKVLFPPLPHP
jgi:hypothetical protein